MIAGKKFVERTLVAWWDFFLSSNNKLFTDKQAASVLLQMTMQGNAVPTQRVFIVAYVRAREMESGLWTDSYPLRYKH